MWSKKYKDYPKDEPLIKERVEPGKGIIGCEMHDLNGWGNTLHLLRKKKPGVIASLITALFGRKKRKEEP